MRRDQFGLGVQGLIQGFGTWAKSFRKIFADVATAGRNAAQISFKEFLSIAFGAYPPYDFIIPSKVPLRLLRMLLL